MKSIMKRTTKENEMVFRERMDEILMGIADFKDGRNYVLGIHVDFHYSGLCNLTVKDLLDMGDDYKFKIMENLFSEHYELDVLNERVIQEVMNDDLLKSLIIEDNLYSFLADSFMFDFPTHIFNKFYVRLNILLDFGDANYDYTLNNPESINSEEALENSSLLKFIELSGYSKEDFIKYFNDEEDFDEDEVKSEFFSDVYNEIINTTTGMNALTMFVSVPFLEYNQLDYKDSLSFKKGTNLGLYDPFSGAGSVLEIESINEITISKENMRIEVEDDMAGYAVEDIYGSIDDLWKSTIV